MLNPIALVHAQGAFDYALSNIGGVRLFPGGSGSTAIVATITSGTASNVTLSCDLTNLPPSFLGTTCMFTPTSVTPTPKGNATLLTVTVPTTAPYSVFNVTVTGNPAPLAPVTLTLTVGAKVAVNPTATASLSKTSGTVTVQVNVTSSPPFAGFIVGVSYNNSVLQFQAIDYSEVHWGTML